jgi:N6-adenosine-specific RNA methylase IME4
VKFSHRSGLDIQAAGGYSIIAADPAWSYANGGRGAAENHYSTMTVADLCALPVAGLAARDALLFLWVTWPTLPDALAVMGAWGFAYKNCAFVWVKTNRKTPTDFVGLGHWTRGNTEPCLLGVRGHPERQSAGVRQLLVTEGVEPLVAPVGRHSAKPPEYRDRILQLAGPTDGKVELFAREKLPGWDSWGNEVDGDLTLEA